MSNTKFRIFFIKLIITIAALLIVVKICPWAEVDDPVALIVTALLLGIFNTILRPVLIILTLPINILTFGLFILVINGLILYVISLLVPGFTLSGFGSAVFTSILVSLTAWAINLLIRDREKA
jgi:putative membrane protein